MPKLEHDLEKDLLETPWIVDKVRNDDSYAQNLYAALCNNDFQRNAIWPILKDEVWSCSWRYAGGIIADIRKEGDYIDWYCSGMGGLATYDEESDKGFMSKMKYVPEGVVEDAIKQDLYKLGWNIVTEPGDNNI